MKNKNLKEKKTTDKNIRAFLSEIDNKKKFINSFKKRYLNNLKIKNDTIAIKFNSLNNFVKEFERAITLSLEIILSYQEDLHFNEINKNNTIPIKIKNGNETSIKKMKNLSNGNNNYSDNKKNETYLKGKNNILFNNRNGKPLTFRTQSIEVDKNNNIYNQEKINENNDEFNSCNNSFLFKKYSFNKSNNIQNDNTPYHLYLKNQMNYLMDKRNFYNIMKFSENSYKNNFPSLKERTLKTLYNLEYINSRKNKNENNKNDEILKQNNDDNIFDLNKNNVNYDRKVNKIKTKTPIRRALRALIKEKKLFNKSCHQIRNNFNKKNVIIINDDADDLIKEIEKSKKYKLYFSEKYGEGNYYNFLNKYRNGEINQKEIKNELNIISNVFDLKRKNENIIKNKKNNSTLINKNISNDNELFKRSKTSVGIRKKLLIQKYQNDNSINKHKNINNKDFKKLNKSKIPKSNRYNNIEDLINSFNE